jgi:two-component system response regulator FlrC
MEQYRDQQSSAATPITGDSHLASPADYLNFMKTQVQAPFLSADEKMARIKEVIEQIADANVPVLITGESGTGKEVIAQTIHQRSNRRAKPFVAINCAALPPSLLESELFGYEKGAFTGAHQRHIGKFEQADGGTLLLDEVTEMEPALQAKLLRALQEKKIERIGGTGSVNVNVRIVATTNRDIKAIVNEGSFRQDLYYRLYVIHMEVPPLRDRPKDIELMSRYYLERFAKQFGKSNLSFSPEAHEKLMNYPWPGNVRELQNIIQRAILMAKGTVIAPHDLPMIEVKVHKEQNWVAALPIGRPMYEVETQFIIETLKSHNGNRTHAAKTLGISLRTLRNKINEFSARGLEVPQPTTGR